MAEAVQHVHHSALYIAVNYRLVKGPVVPIRDVDSLTLSLLWRTTFMGLQVKLLRNRRVRYGTTNT